MSFSEKRSRIRRVADIGAESPLGTPPARPDGPRADPPDPDWRDAADGPLIDADPEKADQRLRGLENADRLAREVEPLGLDGMRHTNWQRVDDPTPRKPGWWYRCNRSSFPADLTTDPLPPIERLDARWQWLLDHTPIPLPPGLWPDLRARFTEPHRAYHDATHIAECLALLAASTERIDYPLALELAVWYHDAVYDPEASDNEAQSADLAVAALAPMDEAVTSRVAALIRCTAGHRPGEIPDAPLLLDIDLAILGATPARYAEFEAGIRQEYAWVPEARYREARAAVLIGFLARPGIYLTKAIRKARESQARKNLATAILQLTR